MITAGHFTHRFTGRVKRRVKRGNQVRRTYVKSESHLNRMSEWGVSSQYFGVLVS